MSLSGTDPWWECSCLERQNPNQVSLSSSLCYCHWNLMFCCKGDWRNPPLHCKPRSFPIFYCSALTMAVLNYFLQNWTPGFGWFPLNIIYSPHPLLIFDLFHVIKWLSPGSAFALTWTVLCYGKPSLQSAWNVTFNSKESHRISQQNSFLKENWISANPPFSLNKNSDFEDVRQLPIAKDKMKQYFQNHCSFLVENVQFCTEEQRHPKTKL